VFFVPIGKICVFLSRQGKNCVFFVQIGEKFVFFGRDRPFYPMHFISHFLPFFTQKERERENREKKAGKRETATTLVNHDFFR
jgi:hypothetical protein